MAKGFKCGADFDKTLLNNDLEKKLSLEMVWQNASPTSEFVGQDVSLPVTLNEKDVVIVEGWEDYECATVCYTMGTVGKQSRMMLIANNRQLRGFSVTTTSIKFNDAKEGQLGTTVTTNNKAAIPNRIFLLKGVS
jgi:hypothetical protein